MGQKKLIFNADSIPLELKELPQWVVWRLELREGSPTKVPYDPNNPNKRAKINVPSTWATFEKALIIAESDGFQGVGFVFSRKDPFCGVDLDLCRDPKTGKIEPWAKDKIKRLNSYTEASPSDRGLHIILKGQVPPGGNRKGQVEMYSERRFFCMTGAHLPGTPPTIEDRQAELEVLHSEIFSQGRKENPGPKPAYEPSDDELIGKARQAVNGDKFGQLWGGDTTGYPSPSEATAALIKLLVFWCGPAPERIDRLFRQSVLMRPKWDRPQSGSTWGRLEIEKAIAGATEFYQGSHADDRPGPEGEAGPDRERDKVSDTNRDDWPEPLREEAYHGLVGEFVRAVEPHTEADPVAVMIQFLTAFGNAIGRGAYYRVERDFHHAITFSCLVGETSKARKGTSKGHVDYVFREVDPEWARNRMIGGLSSGEGLIWEVRDPIFRREAVREHGRPTGKYEEVEVDPGADDKRLMVYEPEFASVLKVMNREGNTLSDVIRKAWDSCDLRTLTKNSPAKATGTHISVIGHITVAELRRYLDKTEMANGFGNRFIWICVKRSKILPEGGQIERVDFSSIIRKLKAATEFGKQAGEITMNPDAREIWRAVYGPLSEGKPGLFGALVARAEAQVVRLACIYALLDLSHTIRPEHLAAALSLWDYAEASVKHIFGDATGDPIADQILSALRDASEGLTQTAIHNLFGRHKSAEQIQKALIFLKKQKLIQDENRETGGRPTIVWKLIGAKKAK